MYQNISSIQAIDFFLQIEEEKSGVIDLSKISFIRPVGVVALLTMLERCRHQYGSSPIELRPPEDDAVRQYLVRAGVYDVMREQGWQRAGRPGVRELVEKGARQMVPCTRFRNESRIDELAEQMEERFATEFRGIGSLLGTLETIFCEMAMNVVHHAESGGGYVLAQQYEYRTGPIVEIAIADSGIGIRTSLGKNLHNPTFKSDSEAIESATREGVSSISETNRGYGFHHVTYDLQRDKTRSMTIRSGTGTITIRGDGTVRKTEGKMGYSGTIVQVLIPCERS